MRSLLLIILSFTVTILCWGVYVPVLHWGQHDMATDGGIARLRPFVCVGLAYFLIGVIVPAALLSMRGEKGAWTARGIVVSLLGGALGALGALGIILAINFGGNPLYVAPLVFGGAPVVNSFLTIFLAKKMREIGPFFIAGLVIVVLGAVTVLLFQPKMPKAGTANVAAASGDNVDAPASEAAEAPDAAATAASDPKTARPIGKRASRFVLQLLSIGLVIVCWGAYGPTLHKGQAAMMNSRLRPLLCVGLAYFAIAVVVPNLILAVSPEASTFARFSGTMWSLLAGAAGAIGALGIIMAFNFGGKPIYVMPLIFGGAPVVATLVSTATGGLWGQIGPMFLAGLMLVIAGAVMVLVFAPKGHPPAAVAVVPVPTPPMPREPSDVPPASVLGGRKPAETLEDGAEI